MKTILYTLNDIPPELYTLILVNLNHQIITQNTNLWMEMDYYMCYPETNKVAIVKLLVY